MSFQLISCTLIWLCSIHNFSHFTPLFPFSASPGWRATQSTPWPPRLPVCPWTHYFSPVRQQQAVVIQYEYVCVGECRSMHSRAQVQRQPVPLLLGSETQSLEAADRQGCVSLWRKKKNSSSVTNGIMWAETCSLSSFLQRARSPWSMPKSSNCISRIPRGTWSDQSQVPRCSIIWCEIWSNFDVTLTSSPDIIVSPGFMLLTPRLALEWTLSRKCAISFHPGWGAPGTGHQGETTRRHSLSPLQERDLWERRG